MLVSYNVHCSNIRNHPPRFLHNRVRLLCKSYIQLRLRTRYNFLASCFHFLSLFCLTFRTWRCPKLTNIPMFNAYYSIVIRPVCPVCSHILSIPIHPLRWVPVMIGFTTLGEAIVTTLLWCAYSTHSCPHK